MRMVYHSDDEQAPGGRHGVAEQTTGRRTACFRRQRRQRLPAGPYQVLDSVTRSHGRAGYSA